VDHRAHILCVSLCPAVKKLQEQLSAIESVDERTQAALQAFETEVCTRLVLQRSNENLQSHLDKTTKVKDKLEALCRDLQKRNEETRNAAMEQQRQHKDHKVSRPYAFFPLRCVFEKKNFYYYFCFLYVSFFCAAVS
jgi:hypothetical protein